MAINHTINITAIQHIDSFTSMLSYVNKSSGHIFFTLMIIATYLILIFIQKRYGLAQAIAISSTATFVMALFFGAIGLVTPSLTILFFTLTLISGFYLYVNKKL